MSQATIERPVSKKRAASSTAKPATTPREKIFLQLAKLQGLIALMVETEQGDCVGRVLEHAGTMVPAAIEFFAAGNEKDVDAAYEEMLQADSFIKAAGALVAQEFNVSSRSYNGRSASTDSIVNLSEDVTTAIDTYLMEMRRSPGEHVAPPPAPSMPEEAPGPVAADDAADRRQLALEASWQIESLTMLLLDVARRDDAGTTRLHLPMVVKALGLRIEQLNGQIMTVASSSCDGEPTVDIAAIVNGTSDELVNTRPT